MDKKLMARMAETDRKIQHLIEEHNLELTEFICNNDDCYRAAKAMVAFVLSNHFALKALEAKDEK